MPEQTSLLVTGGGSGIGRAVCILAARAGQRVGVLDRDPEAAEATAAQCPGSVTLTADVTSEPAMVQALASFGTPDSVFAAAGIDDGAPINRLGYDTWRHVLGVNLDGMYITCRVAITAMLRANRGGSVVCASSPAAMTAMPDGAAYAASKGGVSALVRSLAIDHAVAGIRVNAIVPGSTETPLMWARAAVEDREQLRRQVEAAIPMGRLAEPVEVARAVLWLLSSEASYVTGSQLVVDGGLLARSACIV